MDTQIEGFAKSLEFMSYDVLRSLHYEASMKVLMAISQQDASELLRVRPLRDALTDEIISRTQEP